MADPVKVEDLTLDDVFLVLRDQLLGVASPDDLEGIDILEVEDNDRSLVVTLCDADGRTRPFEITEYGVTLQGVDS